VEILLLDLVMETKFFLIHFGKLLFSRVEPFLSNLMSSIEMLGALPFILKLASTGKVNSVLEVAMKSI